MEHAEAEARIKATIDAHIALATEYKRIMMDLENKASFFCLEKQAAKRDGVGWQGIVLRVFRTIGFFILDLYAAPTNSLKPETVYIFKPYVKYILSTHIRRQYQKLNSLYLAELVPHRKDAPKEDVGELRQIATDIGEYSKTLPSLKSLTALLLAALSIIGTVFGIFDVKVTIDEVLSLFSLATALSLLFLIFTVGSIITLSPLIAAFSFTRFLFKDKNSADVSFFSYSVDPKIEEQLRKSGRYGFEEIRKAAETQLYNSSIYKIEDDLFKLLGGKEQKPKEVPIDIILRVTYISIFIAIYIPSLLGAVENIVMVLLAISIGVWLGLGVIEYKKRVNARLA